MNRDTECPICLSRCKEKSIVEQFIFFSCFKCGHESLVPMINDTDQYYESEEYFRDGQKMISSEGQLSVIEKFPQYRTMHTRVRNILKYTPINKNKKKRLLDVGCGTGLFVELAGRNGFESIGVDISESGVRIAKKHGFNCYRQRFVTDFSDEPIYDVITMFDCIEHIPKPKEYLQKAYNLLKNNGLLIITTPRVDSFVKRISGSRWHLYTPPRHLNLFTSTSINSALNEVGFLVEDISNTGQYTNFGYMINKLAMLYNFSHLVPNDVIKMCRMDKLNIYINLYDVMAIVARKKG